MLRELPKKWQKDTKKERKKEKGRIEINLEPHSPRFARSAPKVFSQRRERRRYQQRPLLTVGLNRWRTFGANWHRLHRKRLHPGAERRALALPGPGRSHMSPPCPSGRSSCESLRRVQRGAAPPPAPRPTSGSSGRCRVGWRPPFSLPAVTASLPCGAPAPLPPPHSLGRGLSPTAQDPSHLPSFKIRSWHFHPFQGYAEDLDTCVHVAIYSQSRTTEVAQVPID